MDFISYGKFTCKNPSKQEADDRLVAKLTRTDRH